MSSPLASPAGGLTRRRLLQRVTPLMLGMGSLPLLQACGNDPAQPADDNAVVIEMHDELRFAPDHLTLRVGQTVTWRNTGAMVHTATCDPTQAQDPAHAQLPAGAEPWDSGLISAGASWSQVFAIPGTYAYFCVPHEAAGMVATLVVEE